MLEEHDGSYYRYRGSSELSDGLVTRKKQIDLSMVFRRDCGFTPERTEERRTWVSDVEYER